MSILGDLSTLEVKPTAEPEKILKGIVPGIVDFFNPSPKARVFNGKNVVHKLLVDLDFPTYHSESSNCFFYMKMNEPFPPWCWATPSIKKHLLPVDSVEPGFCDSRRFGENSPLRSPELRTSRRCAFVPPSDDDDDDDVMFCEEFSIS